MPSRTEFWQVIAECNGGVIRAKKTPLERDISKIKTEDTKYTYQKETFVVFISSWKSEKLQIKMNKPSNENNLFDDFVHDHKLYAFVFVTALSFASYLLIYSDGKYSEHFKLHTY